MRVYDTDKASDFNDLMAMRPYGSPQVFPRRELYGSAKALGKGLVPVEAGLDSLVQPDQYEDVLKEAHEKQTLPIYHLQATWRPPGLVWNQNGLGYCWTWSGTGCLMTCRAMEGKPTVLLAPVSMGYLVGWADRGNYLDSFIQGARNDGVCPAIDGDFNSTDTSASYWAQYKEQRKLYRLDTVWDTNTASMKQHCLSGLSYGRSGYAAWIYLSHAMELVSIHIVNGVWYWDISNSHLSDKGEVITMTGSRAAPSECYFFVSTEVTE